MGSSGSAGFADLVAGAVDLYVHAAPDLFERHGSDLDLARSLESEGIASAVHRHHFACTAERASLVREVTGFDLRGAILCNDSVGGLNPWAVEWALAAGAVWVSLPTLSARAQRRRAERFRTAPSKALTFGPCDLTLTDDRGALRPEVSSIIGLTTDSGAVLNLGYATFEECMAVLDAVEPNSGARLVVTNPATTMDLSTVELDRMMEHPGLFIEQTAYSLHPTGSHGGAEHVVRTAADQVARYGAQRLVLSSDSGLAIAPTARELLGSAMQRLAEFGVAPDDLEAMTHETPSTVLDLRSC